ncbi:hypothetical protein FE782_13755 [Paenibacillus antri]|uniref:Uncharacterized protein n=1 Tax=Paenibacillus antri TaxID=2582848 RepID=A0A5R9GB78_9BACL|nr:hypothetical protein [Paenibacillus antri]TLS51566.1 hypothetical protein FE782_13755 [Paenibacillus antri]
MRDIWERVDLNGLAEANVKRFAATIYALIEERRTPFDLLLVGGNTGVVMARLALLVYERLRKTPPYVVKTTPQRYEPGREEREENLYDNSILELDVGNQLADYRISEVGKALFVDDEISAGTTARICLRALLSALPASPDPIEVWIVAEDQGFRGKALGELGRPAEVRFMPFAPGVDGLSNVVTYVVPYDIKTALNETFPDDVLSPPLLCNLLLDLPIRDKTVALSGFHYRYHRIARERIPELPAMQRRFLQLLRRLVDEGIEAYRSGALDLAGETYVRQYIASE